MFLDERKIPKIDEKVLIQVLTHLKELELMKDAENESDEFRNYSIYLHLLNIVDAFVALGGLPTREGTISKNTLIDIIKTEFEEKGFTKVVSRSFSPRLDAGTAVPGYIYILHRTTTN